MPPGTKSKLGRARNGQSGMFGRDMIYKGMVMVAGIWFCGLIMFAFYEGHSEHDGPRLVPTTSPHAPPAQHLLPPESINIARSAGQPDGQPERQVKGPGLLGNIFSRIFSPDSSGNVKGQALPPLQQSGAPDQQSNDLQWSWSLSNREPPRSLLIYQGNRNILEETNKFEPISSPDAPGEMGRPVNIEKDKLEQNEQKKFQDGWDRNSFNEYVSNMINTRRRLADVRDDECKTEKYQAPEQLPYVSVVVCFHNEAWTVLLRSVYSIVDHSDQRLLREVILVDDYSSFDHLKQPLEDYISSHFKKVKVVRTQRREGLIRARLFGASNSKGDVIIFLDSHIECTEGWLEPLLAPIAANWSTVVCPVIDVIDDTTFAFHYNSARATQVGGFDWNLQYNWRPIPESDKPGGSFGRRRDIDPVRTPTMAGGLFAIHRLYFDHLGTYDSGMEIWGGENLELSFRIWMCGGSLVTAPCSHVGHIFRKRSPYSWSAGGPNPLKKNSVRLAEVWMDEYKKYYYERINFDLGDFGDITERKSIRERLQCKSFSWFVKTIFPDLFVPGESYASGEIRNKAFPMCIDSPADHNAFQKPVKMWPCHNQGGNQYWLFSKNNEIRRDEACVDYTGQGEVIMYQCHGMKGNQHWEIPESGLIHHVVSNTCMEVSEDGKNLRMSRCDANNSRQNWSWKRKNPEV